MDIKKKNNNTKVNVVLCSGYGFLNFKISILKRSKAGKLYGYILTYININTNFWKKKQWY